MVTDPVPLTRVEASRGCNAMAGGDGLWGNDDCMFRILPKEAGNGITGLSRG